MRQRRGFTLVELAIVLVIIGLLIGGILAAQSMIETTRINAQIRQLQQLDTVTQNFLQKYNRLPGDKNSDGLIQGYYAGEVCHEFYWAYDECWSVFAELSSMEGLPGNYTNISTGNVFAPNRGAFFGPGRYGPYAAFGKGGIFAAQSINLSNIFWVVAAERGCMDDPQSQECALIAFTPAQALALDSKIDDGNGYTGNVVVSASGYDWSVVRPSPSTPTDDASHLTNPNDYAFSVYQGGNYCINTTNGAYEAGSVTTSTCGLQFKANISH